MLFIYWKCRITLMTVSHCCYRGVHLGFRKNQSTSLSQWLGWGYPSWQFVYHCHKLLRFVFSCLTAAKHQQNSLLQRNTAKREICAQYPFTTCCSSILVWSLQQETMLDMSHAVSILQVCHLRLLLQITKIWATQWLVLPPSEQEERGLDSSPGTFVSGVCMLLDSL